MKRGNRKVSETVSGESTQSTESNGRDGGGGCLAFRFSHKYIICMRPTPAAPALPPDAASM